MPESALKYYFIVALCLVIGRFAVAQDVWKLESEKDGIRVYSNKNDTEKFKSFKANTIMEGRVEAFVGVLQDIPNYSKWITDMQAPELLKRTGDTIQIYYGKSSVPYPFDDRDGIYLNRFSWNSKNKELYVEIKLLPEYLSPKKNIVRVKGKGYYRVKVLPQGKLDVTLSMQVDPGGEIPAWLVNMFVFKTPVNTLMGLSQRIREPQYQKKTYGFIR
jgi:hypothetical protein